MADDRVPAPRRDLGRHDRAGLVAAAAVLVLVVVADLLAGSGQTVLGLVVVAPLLAANITGPRGTAGVTVAALAVGAVLGVYDHQYGDDARRAQLVRLLLVAAGGAAGVLAARVRVAREDKLAAVTRVAETAQHAILPDVPQRLRGLRIAVRYVSASSEASIGGDLYAVEDTAWGPRLLVGDVRGKGLDAVRLSAVVVSAFRDRAEDRACLADLAADLDRVVGRNSGEEDFVTAVLAQLDDDGLLTVLNAGHPPPVLLRDGQALELTGPDTAPPLGVPGPVRAPSRHRLQPGDRVLVVTDGALEARRPGDRAFFPLLPQALAAFAAEDLDDALDTLLAALRDWTGHGLADDVALLAVALPAR